jgi:putative aldouronate transport system substrate-binding protein
MEGNDYTKENGKYVLTELGKKHSNDHGAPVPISSKFKHPIGWNPGFEDAMKLIDYASAEAQIAETSKFTEIFSKHTVKIVKGDVSVTQGLADMRAELKQAAVID